MKNLLISIGLALIVSSTCAAQNSPTGAMNKFMSSWKSKNWRTMAKATQISQRTTSDSLKAQYDLKDLVSFKILSSTKKAQALSQVVVKATYTIGTFKTTVKITGNVICEDSSGNPTPNGTWGVNAISMFREQKI